MWEFSKVTDFYLVRFASPTLGRRILIGDDVGRRDQLIFFSFAPARETRGFRGHAHSPKQSRSTPDTPTSNLRLFIRQTLSLPDSLTEDNLYIRILIILSFISYLQDQWYLHLSELNIPAAVAPYHKSEGNPLECHYQYVLVGPAW